MSVPKSVAEFLEIVTRSGVIAQPELDAAVGRLVTSGRMPTNPVSLADALVQADVLTAFQASQFLQGRWRRFVLCGKYRLLRPIGTGGMGIVYLCEHLVMRRQVAIKVLPSANADSASVERFRREARAVAALDHPHIVRAYDIDRDGPFHLLVMEYVDGRTLYDVVRGRGALPPVQASHYVAQAALGLQHAHEAGLIHRDVKPGNLILDRFGTVKLLDLGLAKFPLEGGNLTDVYAPGTILGTADYLAPEQISDSGGVDIRADIYALGATFYFLLTGRPPFDGTVRQKLMRHQLVQPVAIREVRPDVPEALAVVIEKMMAKDPAGRYEKPGELADALRPWTLAPVAPPDEWLDVPESEQSSPLTPRLHRTPSTGPTGPSTQLRMLFEDDRASESPTVFSGGKVSSRRSRFVPWALFAVLAIGAVAAALTLNPRPPQSTTRLLVPAYFYPAGDELKEWDRLIESSKRVPIVAVVNPSSGPGEQLKPDYVSVVKRAKQAGLTMVGYVSTAYAKRPVAEVKTDMDRWLKWYPEVSGFFLDEQSSSAEWIAYYSALHEYARQLRPDALVVSNPGTQCAEPFLSRPATDVVCLFETEEGFDAFHPPAWTKRYSADRFAALSPGVSGSKAMREVLRLANEKRIGYVFVTDLKGANPWAGLPSYWEEEVEAVRKQNGG